MLALPGYILYPTAPPRMLLDEGFVDALQTAALNQSGFLVTLFGNPYAAMPSLHTATAILVGSTGVLVTRHLLVRLMWAFYPALVVFSIVATANHFFLDAIAGVGILAAALTIVITLHRHKGWSLEPLSRPLIGANRPLVDGARRGRAPACHLPLDEHVAHAPGPDQVRLHRRRPPARHARRARPQREPRHAQPADRARLRRSTSSPPC